MYFMPNIMWLQKDLKISFMVNMGSGSLGYCLIAIVLSLMTSDSELNCQLIYMRTPSYTGSFLSVSK